jgi:hypothetical protein
LKSHKAPSPKSRASNGAGITGAVGAVEDKVEDTVGTIGSKVDAIVDKTRSAAGTVAKGTAAAAVATVVAGVAGRALISSRKPKRVLGVPVRRRGTGMKSLAKRVSDIAEHVEKNSLDVSKASGQAKHAAAMLS